MRNTLRRTLCSRPSSYGESCSTGGNYSAIPRQGNPSQAVFSQCCARCVAPAPCRFPSVGYPPAPSRQSVPVRNCVVRSVIRQRSGGYRPVSPTIVRIVIALAAWVLFRMLASTYDAVVSTSGYFGLGMGATPTAIVVMTATNASSFRRPSLGMGKADAHAIGPRRGRR